MRTHFHIVCACLVAFFLLSAPGFSQGASQPRYLFKIASLAPANSIWAKRFTEFAEAVTRKTGGEVGFKIYAGGVMGDERAMYRKMRAGQIQGGGFTMTGIGEVVPDFRVMSVPFLFHSYQEVDQVTAHIWPQLKEAFAAQGLELIAPTEVGFVYTLSTEPIDSVEALRRSRSWAPDGDPISLEFLKAAKVSSVPLLIPDVLPSLESGMVNAVYNSFYGSIILQWHYKIKYITDIPFAYAYGAFVLDRKKFSALPPEFVRVIEGEAREVFGKLLADTRQSNAEALAVLKEKGVIQVTPGPQAVGELYQIREKTIDATAGTAFSAGIYRAVVDSLEQFHKENPGCLPGEQEKQGPEK